MLLSLIGSAGRRDDLDKVSYKLFLKMYEHSKKYIEENGITHLKSGGAAFADHLAVVLFLKGDIKNLHLALPGKFEKEFSGNKDCETANYYHQRFQEKTGIESLSHIALAIERGAIISCHDGFMARNSEVAQCDYLLAFTFGAYSAKCSAETSAQEAGLKKGGTADTWNKSTATVKVHVNLNEMMSE